MSNLWLNLRLFCWHLQIGPSKPHFSVTYNRAHEPAERQTGWKRIELYALQLGPWRIR